MRGGGDRLTAPKVSFPSFRAYAVSEESILLKRFFSLCTHFKEIINSPHPSYRHLLPPTGRRKKIAFTLAEVLITLGIIGVVAALTMPSLIQNQKNKELREGLKKQYSSMQQALQKMSVDMGETPKAADFPQQQFKAKYMKYFNVVFDCGFGSTDVTDYEKVQAYCPSEQHNAEEGNRRYTKYYKTYNRSRAIDPTLLNNGQFVIQDGALILIENWENGRNLYISVDVNGVKKGPNVWGRDLFTFQLMNDGKLLPMGAEGTDYHNGLDNSYCSRTSSSNFNGVSCTYSAMTDEKYWKELKN